MAKKRRSYALGALLAICLIFAVMEGCGRKNEAGKTSGASQSGGQSAGKVPGMRTTWGLHPMNQPGTVFHVEYSPSTSIVDLATVGRTLRGVSADHSIFLFEDSPELRSKLIPGKFVLFEGLDLRKVDALAVDPKSKNLIVGTEMAPLQEALKTAQVHFKVPVNFNDLFKQRTAQFGPLEAPPQFAFRDPLLYWWNSLNPTVHGDISPSNMEGEFEISDSDFATWKVHYHFYCNPGDSENLHLDLQLAREAKGLDAEITAKGQLSNFFQQTSMLIAQNGIHFDFRDIDLHGSEDFDWVVKSSEAKTPMNEVRLKLPGKVSIPLMEFTGLPMSLQISEALLFHPAFTTKDEVAKGSFKVTYSGDEGFKLDGSDAQTEGQGDGNSVIDQSYAFSPLASFGLVVAMAVPRVELRMGTEELWEAAEAPLPDSLVESLSDVLLNTTIGRWVKKNVGNPLSVESAAYFQVVISTTAAHSGMQSLVPCQQFTMTAKGQIGVDAKWLGDNTNVPAKDIFSKDLVQRQPDSKICGGG